MLNLSTLYTGSEDFVRFLELSRLDFNRECLVRIYASEKTEEHALCTAKEIKSIVPMGKIIGCSASGVTHRGKRYEEATLVVVEQFSAAKIEKHLYQIENRTPYELAEIFANDCRGAENALVHILAGDNYCDVYRYVEEINRLSPTVKLAGGVAGDILSTGVKGFVFDEAAVYSKGIITGVVSGKIYVTSRINLTSDPISPVYTVTKCDGSKILEIDNRPATKWCREQLGMEDMREYKHDWQVIAENDALVRFPFILEGHSGASRFVKYDDGDMSLYFSKLKENTEFRIGYTSPTKGVRESLENCQKLSKVPVEGIFCYSCLFRKHYLENCADWELKPFADYGVCGAFMMGEIGYIGGRNEFLNGACSIVAFAERESYITPDLNVFEDLYKIKDDSNKLTNLVIAKQSTAMSNENRVLLNEILEKQKAAKEQLYIDTGTSLPNAIRFAQENISRSYDKVCFIQSENSALILNHFGQDYYRDLVKKVVEKLMVFLDKQKLTNRVFVYAMNESTLFIAANAEIEVNEFEDFSKRLYKSFRLVNLGRKNELFINRFAVILGGGNIVEKGMAILQDSSRRQSYLTVSQASNSSHDYLENEIEMLHVICHAIDNKLVIPYFQGIYNNREGKITKYEALMRLQDEKGNIYTPDKFMGIAKKYQLYSAISSIMIKKVMEKFRGKDKQVGINLSAYDLNYPPMREFILAKLRAMDSCENFVFEFLEDEEFEDFQTLRDFIGDLRACGAKISIDDFGAGYSSFLEIVRMEPDYIKVDGSIIKAVPNDEISRKVLNTIAGLAAHMGSEIIAEYVENREIQDCLLEMGIPYSQGFLFSVPKEL